MGLFSSLGSIGTVLGGAAGFMIGGPMGAAVGAGIGGSLGGGMDQADAAKDAAKIQGAASQAGIAEQRRQFDKMTELLSPYTQAGTLAVRDLRQYRLAGGDALEAQQAIAGLLGPEKQRAAITQLSTSPEFTGLIDQGERALLQRASATGGLRGGNVQEALAQFRPQMLADYINQQYGRLGGFTQLGQQTATNLAQLGQASAARQGSEGLRSAESISGLLGQQAAAKAGGILAGPQAFQQTLGNVMDVGGMYIGGKSLGVF